MPYIVTPETPTYDSMLATWLLWKGAFGEDALIEFAPFGTSSRLTDEASAIVEVTNDYSPVRLRFARQGTGANAKSASLLVWEHLIADGVDAHYLLPLVELVNGAALGYQEAGDLSVYTSKRVGIHALFDGHSQRDGVTDPMLWEYAQGVIGTLSAQLFRIAHAEKEVERAVVWRSATGAVVAIKNGGKLITDHLHDNGAVLVFYYSATAPDKGRGVMKAPWSDLPLLELFTATQSYGHIPDGLVGELNQWTYMARSGVEYVGTGAKPMEPLGVEGIPDIDVIAGWFEAVAQQNGMLPYADFPGEGLAENT